MGKRRPLVAALLLISPSWLAGDNQAPGLTEALGRRANASSVLNALDEDNKGGKRSSIPKVVVHKDSAAEIKMQEEMQKNIDEMQKKFEDNLRAMEEKMQERNKAEMKNQVLLSTKL